MAEQHTAMARSPAVLRATLLGVYVEGRGDVQMGDVLRTAFTTAGTPHWVWAGQRNKYIIQELVKRAWGKRKKKKICLRGRRRDVKAIFHFFFH